MNIVRIFLICITMFALFACYKLLYSPNCLDCNVILVSIDTLRPDHLGIYGYSKNTTPNIDRIARDSVYYTKSYATSSWTIPSHASMFASEDPSTLKAETPFDRLSDEVVTIPEVLSKYGYYNLGVSTAMYVAPRWNFAQGFHEYYQENIDPKNANDAQFIFPKAIDLLKKNSNKKFFLFIHSYQTHSPYCPPEPYAGLFKENYKGKVNCVKQDAIYGDLYNPDEEKEKLSKDELRRFVSLYDGEIAYVDFYMGQLFDELKKLNLDKKTIIIITSDHGEEFGDHGSWGKHVYTLYEELIRIPLILKIPGKKHEINTYPHSIIDIAPTILDLLNLPSEQRFQGISLLKNDESRPIYFELGDHKMKLKLQILDYLNMRVDIEPTQRSSQNPRKERVGVIHEGWKLIRSFNPDLVELYNLRDDPKEKKNVFYEYPEKAKYLERLLVEKYNLTSYVDVEVLKKNGINADKINKLKSIGY